MLIGESARKEGRHSIHHIALELDAIEHVNEVLTMHMGPEFILVNLSVDMKDNLRVGEVEKIITALDQEIKTKFPVVKRVFVEAEARDSNVSDLKL